MIKKFISDGTFIPDGPPKDPDSTVSYGVNWSSWLQDGETLTGSTWILPAGLTEDSSAFNDTETSILLSGGIVGESYTVTNRITTATQTEDRSMIIKCQQK